MSWDIAYSWTPATSHTTARIRRFIPSNCAVPKWSVFQRFPLPRLISRACKTSQSLCLPVRFISSHFSLVAADLVTSISPASYWTTFKKRCVYFYFMSMSVLSSCALCMPSAQGGQKKSVFSLWLEFQEVGSHQSECWSWSCGPLQEQGPNHWTISPVPKAYFKQIK